MNGLIEDYGVPWLDYSRDAAFSHRYDLFADIDHLNQTGAALFNEQLYAENSIPTKGIGDFLRDFTSAFQREGRHGWRLP